MATTYHLTFIVLSLSSWHTKHLTTHSLQCPSYNWSLTVLLQILVYLWRNRGKENITLVSFSHKILQLEVAIMWIVYSSLTVGISIFSCLFCYSDFNQSHTYWNPINFPYLYNPLSFITRLKSTLQYQQCFLGVHPTKYVFESSIHQSTTTSRH